MLPYNDFPQLVDMQAKLRGSGICRMPTTWAASVRVTVLPFFILKKRRRQMKKRENVIDVRGFIQENYTPYEGGPAFLSGLRRVQKL